MGAKCQYNTRGRMAFQHWEPIEAQGRIPFDTPWEIRILIGPSRTLISILALCKTQVSEPVKDQGAVLRVESTRWSVCCDCSIND